MTTPILTAALARKPRRNPRPVQQARGEGGIKKTAHNYLAGGAKKKPGAALGNRHAARHTREQVDRRARIDALVQQVSITADAVLALADRVCAQRAALAALLREPRP